jgi:hypothetical protein
MVENKISLDGPADKLRSVVLKSIKEVIVKFVDRLPPNETRMPVSQVVKDHSVFMKHI